MQWVGPIVMDAVGRPHSTEVKDMGPAPCTAFTMQYHMCKLKGHKHTDTTSGEPQRMQWLPVVVRVVRNVNRGALLGVMTIY